MVLVSAKVGHLDPAREDASLDPLLGHLGAIWNPYETLFCGGGEELLLGLAEEVDGHCCKVPIDWIFH